MRSTIYTRPELEPAELAAELIPDESPIAEHYRTVFAIGLRLTRATEQDVYDVRRNVISALWECYNVAVPKRTVASILYILALSGHRRAWEVRGLPTNRIVVTTLDGHALYDRLLGSVGVDFYVDRARPDRLTDKIDWHGDKQFRLFGQTTGLFDRVEAYEPGGGPG